MKVKDINLLESLIVLSIVLSPFYVIRFNLWWIPTTLLEMVLIITFIVWLWQRKTLKPPASSFNIPIILILVASLIAVAVSPDKPGALGIFKAYFLEPILFFYLLIDSIKQITDNKKQRLVTCALIFTGLYLSLWGILQSVFGLAVVTPHEQLAHRAHALFNSANSLSLYLIPVLFLALCRLLLKVGPYQGPTFSRSDLLKYSKILRVVIFILILVAVILTKSKGGIIGLIGSTGLIGLIWLVEKSRYRLWLKKLWITIPLYLIIVLSFLWFVTPHFTPKNNNPWLRPANDTLIPRLCLWQGTLNLLKDHPIFGSGLNNFKNVYSTKYYTCDAEPLQYPHNFVLNFWAETGILGLLSVLGILAVFLKQQIHVYLESNDKQSKILSLMLVGIVFYWLIHGLVDVPYFKNDSSLQFWVILALGVLNSEMES